MNDDIQHILFEDESSIRDYQAIQKTWFPKGEQRIIQTHGKHESVKLLGVLNYETGATLCTACEQFDAVIFLNFLETVLTAYPEGNILMVLDNAKIHHAKLLEPFLNAHSRLKLLFLPPYSPSLNLIEELWKWLKETVINNAFLNGVSQIRHAVNAFFAFLHILPPACIIDRLCLGL